MTLRPHETLVSTTAETQCPDQSGDVVIEGGLVAIDSLVSPVQAAEVGPPEWRCSDSDDPRSPSLVSTCSLLTHPPHLSGDAVAQGASVHSRGGQVEHVRGKKGGIDCSPDPGQIPARTCSAPAVASLSVRAASMSF